MVAMPQLVISLISGDSYSRRDWLALCLFAAVMLIALMLFFWIWGRFAPVEDVTEGRSFSSDEARQLKAQGLITDEEFERICACAAKNRAHQRTRNRPTTMELKHTRYRFCPACGYDLRMTPKLCPECGRKFS